MLSRPDRLLLGSATQKLETILLRVEVLMGEEHPQPSDLELVYELASGALYLLEALDCVREQLSRGA